MLLGEIDSNTGRAVIDALKWATSHRAPRRYGTKVSTEVCGKDGGPILLSDINRIDVARRLVFMIGKAVERKQEAEKEALPAPDDVALEAAE